MPNTETRSPEEIAGFLRRSVPFLREKQIIAGFDGFIDTIVKPVRKFGANGNNEYFDTIAEFGAFISEHSHKSTSIQYEILKKKPGGNMPNFIMALGALGISPIAVGMLSTEAGSLYPHFAELGKQRYSYLEAGTATAFEFNDGKIFFSSANVPGITDGEKIFTRIEKIFSQFSAAVSNADLTAFLNWSELPFAQALWDDIYTHAFSKAAADKTRLVFFDLCDTFAKSPGEIEEVFSLIAKISERRRTILSLNKNEALDVCKKTAGKNCSITQAAQLLFERFAIDELVIHQHTESLALCASEGMAIEKCVFNKNPKISTGAGDHFNAAYCFASLAELSITEKLKFANAASGAYIAKGVSPGLPL